MSDEKAGTEANRSILAADKISGQVLGRRAGRPLRRGEQQLKNVRVAIVFSMFLVLLGAAVLVGGRSIIDPILRAAVDQHDSKRMGDIVYTLADGTFCRHLLFDNLTGEMTEHSIEQCVSDLRNNNTSNGRLRAIGFAWGAR
jgi:hypothetical protein